MILVMTAAAGAGRHLRIAAVCASLFCSPIILLIEFQEILIRVGSDSCSQMCEDKHGRPNPRQGTTDHLSPTSTLLGANQTPHMLTADLMRPLHSARLKHNVITTMRRCAANATNTDSRETEKHHMYPWGRQNNKLWGLFGPFSFALFHLKKKQVSKVLHSGKNTIHQKQLK